MIAEILDFLKYTAIAASTLALWFVKYGVHHYMQMPNPGQKIYTHARPIALQKYLKYFSTSVIWL
jgi:hypothetical protein